MRTRQKWRPEESCIARCGWVKTCQDMSWHVKTQYHKMGGSTSLFGWFLTCSPWYQCWILHDPVESIGMSHNRSCLWRKKTTSLHRAFRNRLVKQSWLSQVLHSFYSGRSGAPNAGVPMPGAVRGWDEDLHDRRSLQPTLRYRTNWGKSTCESECQIKHRQTIESQGRV